MHLNKDVAEGVLLRIGNNFDKSVISAQHFLANIAAYDYRTS